MRPLPSLPQASGRIWTLRTRHDLSNREDYRILWLWRMKMGMDWAITLARAETEALRLLEDPVQSVVGAHIPIRRVAT